MKNHSRGHGKRGVGYRTPSMFKADTRFRAETNRQQSGLLGRLVKDEKK